MRIRKMNCFVKVLTFGWATAISLAPFGIYIREHRLQNQRTINHETIHWKQQEEMLYLGFYLWYFLEFLIRIPIHGRRAYKNIGFEREAKAMETTTGYARERTTWAWFKFLVLTS